MDTPLVLILILAFAFAMTHLESFALGDRVRLFSGLEYVVLGALCGPYVLGFFNRGALTDLEPVLSVVTGFIGFLYGLPVSRHATRVEGAKRVGAIIAVTVAVVLGTVFYLIFGALDATALVSHTERVIASVVLGFGAAACSAEAIVGGIAATAGDGPISRLMPRVAATTRVIAILGCGFALAADPGNIYSTNLQIHPALWVLASVGVGSGIGLIFHVFVGDEDDTQKLFVAVIGVIMLASGIAYALKMSPLMVCLIAGITVSNISPTAGRLSEAVLNLGRPFNATLLLIAGAMWVPLPGVLWTVPLVFVAGRIVVLRIAAYVATRRHPSVDPHTPSLGNALLSQGALAAAIAVNFTLAHAHELEAVVMTCLLASAVVNEVWATWAMRRVLQRAGETGRRAPDHPQGRSIDEPGVGRDAMEAH